jgi:alcohol dehydrogenase class IV
VSGLYDAVHGRGLSALLPLIMEQTYPYAKEKFKSIALAFGGNDALQAVDKIRSIMQDINLNCTLTELNVKESDIDWLCGNCEKTMQASLYNNPKIFNRNELYEIYKKCL